MPEFSLDRLASELAAGARGLSDGGDAELLRRYGKLKEVLLSEAAPAEELEAAILGMEKRPDSSPRLETLKEQLEFVFENRTPSKKLTQFLSTDQSITQTGGGAVAQGSENVVAGQGGQAAGGDINTHHHHYSGPVPKSGVDAIRIYREFLVRQCRPMPLRGIDMSDSAPSPTWSFRNIRD
jgi:hypothetical protein